MENIMVICEGLITNYCLRKAKTALTLNCWEIIWCRMHRNFSISFVEQCFLNCVRGYATYFCNGGYQYKQQS
jgi:hypothetical protein